MTQSKRQRPLWVDFHCHLDLYRDHDALITECDREAIATLTVTTTPKAWPRNREMAAASAYVRVALGLHPQLVAEREGELPLFERHLHETRYIGEVGLDTSDGSESITVVSHTIDEVTLAYALYDVGHSASVGTSDVQFEWSSGKFLTLDPLPPSSSSVNGSRL